MLYGCEAWSVMLSEERGLRVYENRILRRIFGPKRDENGKWMLHNEELHSLYCSPNIVRVMKSTWVGHVSRMEEDMSAFKMLTGKPTGRPRRRWEDNIRMDLKYIRINMRDWVDSALDSDYWKAHGVSMLENIWILHLFNCVMTFQNCLFNLRSFYCDK